MLINRRSASNSKSLVMGLDPGLGKISINTMLPNGSLIFQLVGNYLGLMTSRFSRPNDLQIRRQRNSFSECESSTWVVGRNGDGQHSRHFHLHDDPMMHTMSSRVLMLRCQLVLLTHGDNGHIQTQGL